MGIRESLLASGVLTLLLTVGHITATNAQGGNSKKTVWDGVYTSEQANRGQDTYDKKCTECHQDDLSGGGDEAAAVLRGADFFARWNDKSAGELFRKIEESMPKNAPGSLSPAATADVIAFLFKKNQIPASDAEMASDAKKLDDVLITDKPR